MIDLVLFYFFGMGINCLVLRDRLRNVEYAVTMRRVGLFCMLDMDDFKTINDQYGHVVGDSVLKAVAEQLRACSDPDDIVMRIGGDEFGVYVVGITDVADCTTYAQRLFRAIEALEMTEVPSCKIRISLGGAMFSQESAKDFASLYHQSDLALYRAKRSGKGRFCF